MAERIPLWKKLNMTSLMVGAGCVAAGTAAAEIHGNLEVLPATLCLFFVAFAQMAANMANRYYDESHALGRTIDQRIAPGSHTTDSGMLKECAVSMFLLAIMTGLALLTMGGWWIFPVGTFIIVVGWMCCGGSAPLMRTPFSPLVAFVLFGPVCVMSTSVLQSQHEAETHWGWYDVAPSVYMGVLMGLMAFCSNLIYNYSRYYSDLRNCRASFCTEFGRRTTRAAFLVTGILSAGVGVWMCLSLRYDAPALCLIPILASLAMNVFIWTRMRSMPRYRIPKLIDMANFNVLLTGVLWLVVCAVIGVPDDSIKMYFDF